MAKIKVDHSRFAKAAKAVDNYVKSTNSNINDSKLKLDDLLQVCKGDDLTALKKSFDTFTGKNSTNYNYIQAFSSYADFLRFAELKYKTAQSNAYERALKLPKF